MNKIKVKFIIMLFIVFFTRVCIFASVVSENDGPAFVTKSEFEKMKQDFDTQISNYNLSIDNKIDGAIGAYLAGLKMVHEPSNLFENYLVSHGQSPYFYWNIPGTGVKDHEAKVDIFFDKELAYNIFSTIGFGGYTYYSGGYAAMGGGIIFAPEPNWEGSSTAWNTLWKGQKWSTTVDSSSNRFSNLGLNTWSYWSSSSANLSTVIKTTSAYLTKTLDATIAPTWTVLENNGRKSLYLYQLNSCPYLLINAHRHVYNNFATLTDSFYMSDGGKEDYDTNKTDIFATIPTSYGETTDGTNYTGNSTDIGNYLKINLQKIETDNGINYQNVVFPINNSLVYFLSVSPEIKLDTDYTIATVDDSTWFDMYYPNAGGGKLQTNTLYGVNLNFNRPYFEAKQDTLSTFEIPYISSLAGESVYHGDGFPIIQSLSDDTDCIVKIKIKNSDNNNNNVKCLFSNKKLIRDNFDTSAGIKKTAEFACDTVYTIEFEGLKKDEKIWMNPIEGSGDYVYIESISVTAK